MRRVVTTRQAYERGITPDALRWGVRKGKWTRVAPGAYVEGSEPPTRLEMAVGRALTGNCAASGSLAAVLHELDAVMLLSRGNLTPMNEKSIVMVDDCPCTDGLTTMLDLAAVLDDIRWEQALESALRKHLTTIDDIEASLTQRRVGNKRIRRVLALRPHGAPPTGSLLETMMVQLIRRDPSLPTPERQVEVRTAYDTFVAYVDLAWPEYGLFLELDGQQHANQPVYDARRETAVVATKGWLPGRFTWHEVCNVPTPTLRRVGELYEQATRRHHELRAS